MQVNRCVCTGTSFEDILRCASDARLDYDQVLRRTGCGDGCGLCLPYIRVALLTGSPSLPVMTPDEYRRILASYERTSEGGASAGSAQSSHSNARA
jgi:bacterioferritin-associated ferredoxin